MLIFNSLQFILGFVILWKSSELVINGVVRLSRNLKISSFATSFLILGILTSLTEISVGINALTDGDPTVFVGNLVGGSFVILLLIIPLCAVFNKGIMLKNHLDPKKLLYFLILIASPSFLILDGRVSRQDAILLLILYGFFFYQFQKGEKVMEHVALEKLESKTVLKNAMRIVVGAVLIFIASKLLVDNTIYFANLIGIPSFIISLLILSVGTNLPELVIAASSIKHKKSDIAFGDYVGSAAANPLLFGVLTLVNGPFSIETKGFHLAFWIMFLGYVLFYIFARSKSRITAAEGIILLVIYIIFILAQTTQVFLISPKL